MELIPRIITRPKKRPRRKPLPKHEGQHVYPIHRDEYIAKVYKKTDCSLADTAKQLGLTQSAIRNKLKKNPDLRRAFEDVEESRLDLAEQKLLQKIRKGELKAITFFLEHKGKRRGYGKSIEVKSTNTHTHKAININMSLEEATRQYQDLLCDNPQDTLEDL